MFKLNQIFSNDAKLKTLLREANHLQQLQQLWAEIAPEFRAFSQVLSLDQGVLLVATPSAAAASRIKLLETTLLNRANTSEQKSRKIKGLNLNAIKVKVQVKSLPTVQHKRIQPPSSTALTALQTCADQLENPALQQALRNFIKHQRGPR
ncbi:MAG TPA: DciA family protein [Methylophilus sp.]